MLLSKISVTVIETAPESGRVAFAAAARRKVHRCFVGVHGHSECRRLSHEQREIWQAEQKYWALVKEPEAEGLIALAHDRRIIGRLAAGSVPAAAVPLLFTARFELEAVSP